MEGSLVSPAVAWIALSAPAAIFHSYLSLLGPATADYCVSAANSQCALRGRDFTRWPHVLEILIQAVRVTSGLWEIVWR